MYYVLFTPSLKPLALIVSEEKNRKSSLFLEYELFYDFDTRKLKIKFGRRVVKLEILL